MPLDEISDLFSDAGGVAAAATEFVVDAIEAPSAFPPIQRLRPRAVALRSALAETFQPVAQVRAEEKVRARCRSS
eukprot:scaffold284914_cov32-Tisochrysis_lutea.AAC.5